MNCHSTSWGTDISLKHVPWEPWTQMLKFTPSMHTVIFQALIERYWPHPSTTERSLGAGTRCYLSINPSPAIRLAPACHTESTWMCVYLIVLWLFVTQWTVVCQAHLCQARILDWVAISSSRGSFWPRDQTCISCGSCIGRQILYHWATWEVRLCLITKHLKVGNWGKSNERNVNKVFLPWN